MPKTEIDNFTQITKHELILNKYTLNQLKLILYGYTFQDFHVLNTKINFKFNIISDFVLMHLDPVLNIQNNNLIKKDKTITLNVKNNKEYKKFLTKIDNFMTKLQHLAISKNDFIFFVIGWFLKAGSIADLNSNYYHLEIKLKAIEYGDILIAAFKHYAIPFRYLVRTRYIVFYMKKIDDISDFLKLVNAYESMMLLEDKRIKKDYQNNLQRLENLDLLNSIKTNLSNQNQLELIKTLKKNHLFEQLSNKEQIICALRIKYKNDSLAQLTKHINQYVNDEQFVSKSSVSYIFKKLMKLIK